MKKGGRRTLVSLFLLALIAAFITVFPLVFSAVPNPGHPWSQMECSANLCISGGNIGIGTSSPVSLLSLYQSGSNTLLNASNGTINAGIYVGTLSGNYAGASIGTNSNNQFRLFTNGTDRVTVDTSGNVGIGTTGPAVRLDVVGDASGNIANFKSGIVSAATLALQSDASKVYLGSSTGSTDTVLRAGGLAGYDWVTIKSSGNVGIGTPSPSARLHINVSDNQTAPLRVDAFISATSPPVSWWNASWQYRRNITVNGSASALTNYQVNLIINSSNVGNSFNWSTYGNDTRFTWLNTTSNSEQNVSFWIEYWNNATAGNNASIWVKVPNVTAYNVANTTLYMYYGNPGTTYNNSLGGNNTFAFFDDFSGDLSKWSVNDSSSIVSGELNVMRTTSGWGLGVVSKNTYARPFVLEWGSRATVTNIDGMYGWMATVWYNTGSQWYKYGASTSVNPRVLGTDYGLGTNPQTTSKNKAKIVVQPAYTQFFWNDTSWANVSDSQNNNYIIFENYNANQIEYISNVRVRSYASPEPSVLSIGAEQSNTSTVQTQLMQTALYVQNGTGYVGIGTASPDAALSVNGSADKSSGGTTWGTFSDARLKTVDGTFDRGLAEIMQLQPVRFHYREGNALGLPASQQNYGFVAQDVRKAIPEAVYSGSGGYLMISADPILWAMINSIKEQQKQIENLTAQNEALKNLVCQDHPGAEFCRR